MSWMLLVRFCGRSNWHLISMDSKDLARTYAVVMRGRGFEVIGPCQRQSWADLHPLLESHPNSVLKALT